MFILCIIFIQTEYGYHSVSLMIFYNELVLAHLERNIKETIFTGLRGFGHTYGSCWLGHALTTSLWNLKQCSWAERSSWGKSTYQQQFRSDPVVTSLFSSTNTFSHSYHPCILICECSVAVGINRSSFWQIKKTS